MAKLLSILLLALFGLPLVSPLLAMETTVDSAVPMCCRRDGRHQCHSGMTAEAAPAGKTQLGAKAPVCPYGQGWVVGAGLDLVAVTASAELLPGRVSHPASVAQAETMRRVARDRSRQMRGPPVAAL